MATRLPNSKLTGKAYEDSMTSDLVGLLRNRGLSSTAFPMFHLPTPRGAVLSKPDFEIANGGVHIGSAKLGAKNEFLAFKTAQAYSVTIPITEEFASKTLGEVFAVTYPSTKSEKYTLHILARAGRHDEVGLVLENLDDVADSIVKAVSGEYSNVLLRAEPAFDEARRILGFAAESLGATLRGVPTRDLETVFGGHGFFHNVLEAQLPREKRDQTLRLGAAFLFVNQVLFYTLLSRETQDERTSYQPLDFELAGKPDRIQELFDKVYEKDYEPIYGINLTQFFRSEDAKDACASVVRAIVAMAPKLDAPDLAGQIFQTLIPFDLRKPLGAHFTNPGAARLLVRLALEDADVTVLDPACGSGTLLISAYRRIRQLTKGRDLADLHRNLVEERITGIDAMAFSSHLAAVGLALQEPLKETNHVRIGRTDSTRLMPGSDITPTEEVLPTEFRQSTLEEQSNPYEGRTRAHGKGPVKLSRKEPQPFKMEQVDLLVMNPPFTSWENMTTEYRDDLRNRYTRDFGDLIVLRPSQQLFFLLLSERFVKKGKVLSAVLPLTTFTVHAFHNWVRHFIANWTIKYVVVGLERAAFSEDTSLTECLLVARSESPPPGSKFVLIGVKKLPSDLTEDDAESIASRAEAGKDYSDELAIVKIVPQTELLPEALTLAGTSLSLQREYDEAISEWLRIQKNSMVRFLPFQQLFDQKVLSITGGIRTGEHLSYYGSKALVICRSEERMRGKSDRLVFVSQKGPNLTIRDVIGEKSYTFPRGAIHPALRRFSFTKSINVTDQSDLCVFTPVRPLAGIMERMYGVVSAKRYMNRIKETSAEYPKGRWPGRVLVSSGQVCLMRRLDLAAPNTNVLCVWSEEPILPACEGYAIRDLDETQGKLLVMWYNSTPSILTLLSHSTLTRGTWLKLEDFAVKILSIPDLTALDDHQKQQVDRVFAAASKEEWPSLLEQLKTETKGRVMIDDFILKLAGVESESQRERISKQLRLGAVKALEALLKTMISVGKGEDEDDGD